MIRGRSPNVVQDRIGGEQVPVQRRGRIPVNARQVAVRDAVTRGKFRRRNLAQTLKFAGERRVVTKYFPTANSGRGGRRILPLRGQPIKQTRLAGIDEYF